MRVVVVDDREEEGHGRFIYTIEAAAVAGTRNQSHSFGLGQGPAQAQPSPAILACLVPFSFPSKNHL